MVDMEAQGSEHKHIAGVDYDVDELILSYTQLQHIKENGFEAIRNSKPVAEQINGTLQANHAAYCQQAIEARLNNRGVFLENGEWIHKKIDVPTC